MCRWLAYSGEAIYLEEIVSRPENSLVSQSLHCSEGKVDTNGDGFGIGWYGEKVEPGVYRETHPAWGDENLQDFCRLVQSPLFFAHVRASTGTPTTRENCHPFRVGSTMFMHNGQIGDYQKVRREVEMLIEDDLYGFRKGTTDSEAIFLGLLSYGFRRDAIAATNAYLRDLIAIMTRRDIKKPLRIGAAASDGKRIFVLRYSTDARVPSLYYRQTNGGVTIVSEPLDAVSQDWVQVPDAHVTVFEEGKLCSSTPICVKGALDKRPELCEIA
ncbi:class II glutamine amidotransferase [Polycladidibacter hongkongensis]|uniref:class II glutamine amidotransferase n=1 Tax=Polycladidibacter hongkongensis TaxID=1647556 RepID=UPI0009EC639C|nr:class II glutamine amidotransferase [Pseudovibrio hongkongensis]